MEYSTQGQTAGADTHNYKVQDPPLIEKQKNLLNLQSLVSYQKVQQVQEQRSKHLFKL